MGQILIADEDESTLARLGTALAEEGHAVQTAYSGADALAQLWKTEFDVVVADLDLKDVGGLELLGWVKQRVPETEVLLTTARPDLEAAVACLRAGAFDFLREPVEVFDLIASIGRAIERRALRSATSLYRAADVIFATEDPEQLLAVIADVAMKSMSADDVCIMMPDPAEPTMLQVAYSYGLSAEVRDATRIRIGELLAGRAALSREPALVQHPPGSDPRGAGVGAHTGRVRSSIVYPLVRGDRLIAILNLNRTTSQRPFRPADLDRAHVLASQVLRALDEPPWLVRAHAQLEATNRQLADSLRKERATRDELLHTGKLAAVGVLTAGLAHELNNPIAVILGYAQGQLGRLPPEHPCRPPFAAIERHAERCCNLIRSLLAFAQKESALPTWMSGAHIFDRALELCATLARDKGVSLVKLPMGAMPAIEIAQTEIDSALVNLISNAIEATGAGGAVTVSARPASRHGSDGVELVVADTGGGIPADVLPRVFDPFFTTKKAGEGTGLGLAIVQRVVESHRGKVEVHTEPGVGTEMTIWLPISGSGRAGSPAS